MPTSTQTLQGPDLEALLARVPTELGPGATIVAANKLRSGGIAGFFAKEMFEVVVEVDGDDAARGPATPADTGTRADERTGRPDPSWEHDAGGQVAAPRGARPNQPRVSTQAVGFAGVLDRMVRDAGVDDFVPRSVGPALAPDRAVEHGARSEATSETLSAEAPVADEPFEPLVPSLLGRSTATLIAAEGHVERQAAAPAAPPVEAPLAVAVTVPAVPAATPVVAAPIVPSPVPTPAPAAVVPAGLDPAWLTRVGLPSDVALNHGFGRDEPTVELLRLFGQLARPQALPTTKGSVIAVVGARADAIELAEALAEQLGTGVDKVVVATSRGRVAKIDEARRIDSIDLAVEQRRSWRRRRQPTIVAVESPFGRRQGTWATELLDAIEPTMVWGVVEAIRKPEDITDWAVRLGGLDALAVNGLGDTTSPAAVLSTGVPVGLLDGEEATPMRWTTILAEHLEVAA